ncbi:hypothetical protein RIF29_14214 [Crotalaria pallida]|uniref:NAF domain-containing protein n=1 Tax=Crotalaria pallida TaxID=3830 RepID=A0AAN9FF07_CROPI
MICVMMRTYAKSFKNLLLFVLPHMVSLTSYISLNLLRSSLWLQFKPHHIAAGAGYLASKFLNVDLAAHQNIWQEFKATPSILQGIKVEFSDEVWLCEPFVRVLNCNNNSIKDVPVEIARLTGLKVVEHFCSLLCFILWNGNFIFFLHLIQPPHSKTRRRQHRRPRRQRHRGKGFKRETRFTSKSSANEIINKVEEAAKNKNYKSVDEACKCESWKERKP